MANTKRGTSSSSSFRRGEHESAGETDLAHARLDGAARSRGGGASRQAAEVFQALSDPAGVAGGPAGPRALPRVLPVRRGSSRSVVEVEMLSAVSEVLQRLGFTDFTIQLNHRELLTALLNGAGINARFTRPRSWRSTSWTRSAATAFATTWSRVVFPLKARRRR